MMTSVGLVSWLGTDASLKAALFYDIGVGQYYKDPVPGMIGSNTARLSGGGVYVQIAQTIPILSD